MRQNGIKKAVGNDEDYRSTKDEYEEPTCEFAACGVLSSHVVRAPEKLFHLLISFAEE